MKEIELKGLKETVYYEKTTSGMPVYVWKNEKVKGVFSALSVCYGSIHQEFKLNGKNKYYETPSGIAHFIEHLNFYEPDGTTATDFYSKYGSEVNAFTTFDYTCYHLYSTKEFNANLNHLLDFVLTPSFDKKMINKEKSIITEELMMDEDNPSTNLYFTHYKDLFHTYKYKELITGKKEDVESTSLEDISLVYDTFYHPKNMFLIVTGNVNPYDVFKIAEDNLKKKKLPTFKNPKLKKYKEEARVVNSLTEIYGNVANPKVKISCKTPLSNFKNIDEVELRLITSLIVISNFGPTSDLKEELIEKELVNYMHANRSFIEDYLIITVSIETKYPKEVVKVIKEQFKNLKITEENLRRKINANIASLVLKYDDIMSVNNTMQEEFLTFGNIIDNEKEHLENICLDDVNKVIKKIDGKNTAVTILFSNKEENN